MLRFKAQKQLIDHLLIGDKDKYEGKLKVEQFSSLSVLEQILLVYRMRDVNPTVCQQYLESLKRKQEVKQEDSERKKARYESILASKKIEESIKPNAHV